MPFRGADDSAKAREALSWPNRINMMRGVAAGMHYLHTRNPPVIHGDLRSPNLLLELASDPNDTSPRFRVKIADFGLARVMGATPSMIASKITNPRWLAPEVSTNGRYSLMGVNGQQLSLAWATTTWVK